MPVRGPSSPLSLWVPSGDGAVMLRSVIAYFSLPLDQRAKIREKNAQWWEGYLAKNVYNI